jgi:DNA polymerase-1
MRARLLLQVHDELVLEAPAAERREVQELVVDEMQKVIELSVPLLVESGSGLNWRDAK